MPRKFIWRNPVNSRSAPEDSVSFCCNGRQMLGGWQWMFQFSAAYFDGLPMSKMLRMSEQDLQRFVSRGMSRPTPASQDDARSEADISIQANGCAPQTATGRADAPAHSEKGGMVKSKYRAVKTTVDGITFASKAEAKRYQELWAMWKAKKIQYLVLQPVFILADAVTINGRKKPPLKYVADFSYYTPAGHRVIEDVKGMLTPVYKLKRHLMKSQLGIDIVEITK